MKKAFVFSLSKPMIRNALRIYKTASISLSCPSGACQISPPHPANLAIFTGVGICETVSELAIKS